MSADGQHVSPSLSERSQDRDYPEVALLLNGEHEGSSTLYTAIILLASSCSVTAISIPAAIAQMGGWVRGIILTLICVALNSHVSVIVWRINMCCPGHKHYGDLVYSAFEKAPESQRLAAKRITEYTTWAFIFVSSSYNLLVVGECIGWIFPSWRICLPSLMFLGTALNFLLQAPMRRCGDLPIIFWANMVTMVLIIALPLAYFMVKGVDQSRVDHGGISAMAYSSVSSQLQGMGTLVFMVGTQYLDTEIIAEMQNPKEYPKAVCAQAAPFQVIFILVSGVVFYFYLGQNMTANTTDYLPYGIVLQVTSVAIILNTVSNNLVNCVFMCLKLHKTVDENAAMTGSFRDWFGWNLVVGLMLFISWFVANLVPHIQDFAALFGASFGPFCCYVVPIVTYMRIYFVFGADRVPRITTLEWIIILFWLGLCLLTMTSGTYAAALTVKHHWDTLGSPFECNCHYIWDTCACSAARPGPCVPS